MDHTFYQNANHESHNNRLPTYANPGTGLAFDLPMTEQSSFLNQPTLNPSPNMSDANFSTAPSFLCNELDSQAGQGKFPSTYHRLFQSSGADEISHQNQQERSYTDSKPNMKFFPQDDSVCNRDS